MAKTLSSFRVEVGAGHQLRIVVKFEDDSTEQIDFDISLAPRLVQSLIHAAAAAEKIRKAEPGSTVSTNFLWRAKDVRVGTVIGTDELIAVGFATEEGPPVEVVLPKAISEKTIRSLLDELKKRA